MNEEILFSKVGNPNELPESKVIDGGDFIYPILKEIVKNLNLNGECYVLIKYNKFSDSFTSEVINE